MESSYAPNISPLIRKIYRFFFPSLPNYVKKELVGCETVLDLGCGSGLYSPLQGLAFNYSLGVEVYQPYLEECRQKKIHSEYIQADIRSIEFKECSFDAVMMLNVLEHITKEEGTQLIAKCSVWARKRVIIATPNGFLWQDGYDENPFQEHKSGWTVQDLRQSGFTVVGFNGWKKLRGYKAMPRYKPMLLWEVISDVTQKVIYHFPEKAFRLLAIKTLDKNV